ncbi:hypothetical protein L1987_12591 [Smallanthus sonchifolius]|uniref:Uncharacterized protein n=1 Tax=Smallanthus sonchifolius TaxID=185202 RepID=A0ACB9JEM3_9ASTR|nr:hypothetical protein L1987_12591 [Smallanthus sonchifolius]
MGNDGMLGLILFVIVLYGAWFCELGFSVTVTYDSKALVIDGRRRILQSGSVHYPRATPEMWPDITEKAKEGGLDVIETYVFWNYHEPLKGQRIPSLVTLHSRNSVPDHKWPFQVENEYGNVEWAYGVGGELYSDAPDPTPKWGHLRDVHMAIKQCEEYLVNGDHAHQSLGINLQADIYYKTADDCAAFLANYGANVTFNGKSYFLPAWSVSILPDCKNVIFNTAKVVAQKSVGEAAFAPSASVNELSLSTSPWSCIEADEKQDAFLLIQSLGHAALVFLNKKVLAFGYGYHDDASFNISEKISLEQGNNTLDVISMLIGVQNYGPWFDVMGAGLYSVILTDLKNAKKDYSSNGWTYQVGTEGESLGLDKTNLANSSLWTRGASLPINQSLIWYKSTFITPEGKGPISLNLAGMGKGQAWVNGQNIGRYWSTYLSPSTGCDHCDYRGTYDAQKCWKIKSIRFASFGNPKGDCGMFTQGSCHTDILSIVQQDCIGKTKCSVPVATAKFGNPCPGVTKSLAIEALCSS